VRAKKVVRMLSTPITLIILLGLLAAGVWWGYKSVSARVVHPATPCVTVPMTDLSTSAVTVNVYNSGSQRGLAARVSATLANGGFMIGTVGNSDNGILTVLIMGAAADDPEVQLVAAWFVEPEIQTDGRADHTVDVYVGNSFDENTAWVSGAPTSLQIPSGEVCLPATATPTASEPPVEGPQPESQPAEPESAEPSEAPILGPPVPAPS